MATQITIQFLSAQSCYKGKNIKSQKIAAIKGVPSSLRQFLATESPEMKKNAFYFILKALFVL